ncbi:MAG: PEP-CTERM sorting domain-containing protein [Candidatus Tectimicrobiota bacterium]
MDFIDRDSVGGQLSAPAKFLGSWSTLDGVGHLSWDSIVIDESFSPTAVPFRVFISGPGGSAHVFPTANQGVWHTWVTTIVPINQGDWTIDSGTWAGLLANVTDLRVQIERVSNAGSFSVFGPGDRDGVDNVFLGTPVPEPSTWILLAAGLVGLGGYGWRCRQ